MIQFKTRIHLINAKYASKANMGKIFAVSSEVCKNVIMAGIDNKTYKERWAIKKEDNGYIFREVTHNGGINGHHKTIRRLVMCTASSFKHITVIFED
jgi:hypothetical protein